MQKLHIGIFAITVFLMQCTSAVDKNEVNWYKELVLIKDDFAVLDTLNRKCQQPGPTIVKIHLYRERSRRYARAAPLIQLRMVDEFRPKYLNNEISTNEFRSVCERANVERLRYLSLSIADADTVIKYDSLDLYMRNCRCNFLGVLNENKKALEEINVILKIVQDYKSRGKNINDIWNEAPWYSNSKYVPFVDRYSPTVCDVLIHRGLTHLSLGDTINAQADFSKCLDDKSAMFIPKEFKLR